MQKRSTRVERGEIFLVHVIFRFAPPPAVNNDPFWVKDFLYIVVCTSFRSSQNGTGLVPREAKKTQMKNITVMTHQTVTGPTVLKNRYGKSAL